MSDPQFKTFIEELLEAKEESKRTGKRVRKLIDRAELIKQFPNFASDPRSAFTPNNVVIDCTPHEAILVSDLRKLCLACGDEFAQVKFFSVQHAKDNEVVYLLREDLDRLKAGTKSGPAITPTPDTPIIKPKPEAEKEPKSKTEAKKSK